MRTSTKGLALIESFEGYVGRPYNDAVGYATVGFGHLIGYRAYTAADVRRFANWTRADFEDLLREDIRQFEDAVNRAIHTTLTQGQYDALVSLAYNCGPGAVQGNIARLANSGQVNQIPAVMRQYVHAGGRTLDGLVRRREAEIAVFNGGGKAAVQRHTDPFAHMTANERRWCSEYDRLKSGNRNILRRRALRRAMTKQRKRIYSAGQASGWEKAHRRERYHALLARTT
jgi:lysozyme